MAGKAVISLTTGLEDAEKVTVAFPSGLTFPVPLRETGLPAVAAAVTPLMFAKLMLVVFCASAGTIARRITANKGNGLSRFIWRLWLNNSLSGIARLNFRTPPLNFLS